MTWAQVVNSTVVQTVDADVQPDGWIAVPDALSSIIIIGWKTDGVTFTAPTVVPYVPPSVTIVQAAYYLSSLPGAQAGKTKWDDVEAVVAASGNTVLQLIFSRAVAFDRTSPMLAQVAAALGWTDADLDDLFLGASRVGLI